MGASTRHPPTRARTRTGAVRALAPTLAAALALAAAATACSGPESRPAPAPRSTSANSASPRATSPVRLCFDLISYWAGQDLRGSTWAGLDWEQKGMSNQQFEIYDDIVHAARAEQRRRGAAAARKLISQETLRRCTAEGGATHSSENWRPPS
ncbi:hypothetical protein AB0H07_09785 [Streptomyces sp. NPDC021354]|uniref:hypothetical protein n=1 Tax=unclassified Streptomyces TaxID=2593676 RepID=UPI0033D38FF4